MSTAPTIVNPYDVGQIIAPFKGQQPRLWQALDTLNSGMTALNKTITQIQAIAFYDRFSLVLPLTGSTDLLRYVVQIPIDHTNYPLASQFNITKMVITSKVASAGDTIDLLVSVDRGTTFNSILKPSGGPIVYNKGNLPAGLTYISYGVSQFSKSALFDNNFLRVDLLAGTIGDGLTIDLMGYYSK